MILAFTADSVKTSTACKENLMRKSNLLNCFGIFLLFIFVTGPAYSDKNKPSAPVILAYQIERTGDFLLEPGNNPIEILRRFARLINQNWPTGKKILTAASLLDFSTIGKQDFLKPVFATQLSKQQQEKTNLLIKSNSEDLDKILAECFPAKEGLTLKVAFDVETIAQKLRELTAAKKAPGKLSEQQLTNIKDQFLPLINRAEQILLAGSISMNGIFVRAIIKSKNGGLYDEKTKHDLSVSNIANHRHLMLFAQTFPIEDPDNALKKLHSMPQTASVLQMVASAGLDFKKDILANAARESILYVNLEPKGIHGWPDIRFVAPVPDAERLRDNLPKFKTLCNQTGIFARPGEENGIPLVELSYFMFPDKPVYAGLLNNYLIIATSKDAIGDEGTFIAKAMDKGAASKKELNGFKRYWRVKTDNLNFQLQRFLQSPLLRDKGIPPISNLTLFDDLGDLEVYSTSEPEQIGFYLDLPIKKIKDK